MKNGQHNPHWAKYSHKPIRSIPALALALGINHQVLIQVASRANELYRLANPIIKPDGSIRQTFDALPVLKAIQVRIQQRILRQVKFPGYLTGSLPGCSPRTNAAIHVGSKIAFAEDIANFFPSINITIVQKIWCDFFGFSKDVGMLLAVLTVKDNSLPQGTVTSPFLANLVFWDYEPNLVEFFKKLGYRYSRYVDDISVSSPRKIAKEKQAEIVSNVYGMLLHYGLEPKRTKHQVFTAGRRMETTKLGNNTRVSLLKPLRQNARAAVFTLENRINSGERGDEVEKELRRVASKVGRLGSFHVTEATKLKARLRGVRAQLVPENYVMTQFETTIETGAASKFVNIDPPWDI